MNPLERFLSAVPTEMLPAAYEKLTAMMYEKLTAMMLESALKQFNAERISVQHDQKVQGKSGHQHQIDVLAEFYVAGLRFLVAVECKMYLTRRVGIDEILEVSSRIEDIGAHKGVIVTTQGFQEGALTFAKSRGIGLIKLDTATAAASINSLAVIAPFYVDIPRKIGKSPSLSAFTSDGSGPHPTQSFSASLSRDVILQVAEFFPSLQHLDPNDRSA